jgi:hypothetical protein
LSGAGGGTGGRGGRGGGGGGSWDGDEGEDIDPHTLLTDAGLHADHVPPDVLAALRAGRIGPPELANWKAVLNSPLARFLASIGYVRDRLIAEPRLLSILAIELGLGSVCSLMADYVSLRLPARIPHLCRPDRVHLWPRRPAPATAGLAVPKLVDTPSPQPLDRPHLRSRYSHAPMPVPPTTSPPPQAARGSDFARELDFVLANQVVITLTNAALVLMLTPAAAVCAVAAATSNGLPGFFLQSGPFSARQRAACFGLRAAQFAAVGATTAAAGQGLTMGLVACRKRLRAARAKGVHAPTGQTEPLVQLAPIGPTCTNYAAFMSVSSNTRYQIVNSVEARCVHLLPVPLRVPLSACVRLFNNYVGSASWIWWAKNQGLQ